MRARTRTVLQHIAANCRRQRAKEALTQEELAERADLPLRTLQTVERAQTNMSIETLVTIAAALKLSPGALFKKTSFRRTPPGRPAARKSRGR
jgi:transcriptional regulator with XRE-family HTH domain